MGRRFSWRKQCGTASRPQIQKLFSPIQRYRTAINSQVCRKVLVLKKEPVASNYDCVSRVHIDAIAQVVYGRVMKAMAEKVAKTTVTAVSNSFKDFKGDIPTTGFTYYATVKMDELQMDDALENGKELNESCSSSDVYGSHLDHQDSDVMISENNIDDDDKGGSNPEDSELEAIKARVREMEEEAEKLRQLQTEVDRHMNIGSPPGGSSTSMSIEEKMEVDARSVYVGNVDYGATAEELEQHFHGCGSINRVTILCNKFDGHPKGFAYVEFADRESVNTAMAMDESLFRGRQIKVMPKRTNRPGLSRTDRPPRGSSRGSFSRASFRGRGGSYPFRGHRFPRRYRARGSYFAPY